MFKHTNMCVCIYIYMYVCVFLCVRVFVNVCVCFCGTTAPNGPGPSQCPSFTITLRHTMLGRTRLNEWSARRRDLYLTTHNTHNRQTSTPSAGIEPSISASERPQTHALGRAATGIGTNSIHLYMCIIQYYKYRL